MVHSLGLPLRELVNSAANEGPLYYCDPHTSIIGVTLMYTAIKFTVMFMCLGKQLPANTSLEICMPFLCGTLVENGKRSTIGEYPCNQHVNKQATEIRER